MSSPSAAVALLGHGESRAEMEGLRKLQFELLVLLVPLLLKFPAAADAVVLWSLFHSHPFVPDWHYRQPLMTSLRHRPDQSRPKVEPLRIEQGRRNTISQLLSSWLLFAASQIVVAAFLCSFSAVIGRKTTRCQGRIVARRRRSFG